MESLDKAGADLTKIIPKVIINGAFVLIEDPEYEKKIIAITMKQANKDSITSLKS